jgi:hypothetical protein
LAVEGGVAVVSYGEGEWFGGEFCDWGGEGGGEEEEESEGFERHFNFDLGYWTVLWLLRWIENVNIFYKSECNLERR